MYDYLRDYLAGSDVQLTDIRNKFDKLKKEIDLYLKFFDEVEAIRQFLKSFQPDFKEDDIQDPVIRNAVDKKTMFLRLNFSGRSINLHHLEIFLDSPFLSWEIKTFFSPDFIISISWIV
jgi:hypothetical protein